MVWQTLAFSIFKKPKNTSNKNLESNKTNQFETMPEVGALNSKENSTTDYISPNEKIGNYETNDLVEVGSVTEETTKLLNKKV